MISSDNWNCRCRWSRRGVSIVEILVVVAAIAVMIATLLPALSLSQRTAWRTARLASVRSCGMSVIGYTTGQDYSFPYQSTPMHPEAGFTRTRGWISIRGPRSYFSGASFYWPTLMEESPPADVELKVDPVEDGWMDEDGIATGPCPVRRSYVLLTCTTAAAPAYWIGENPDPPRHLCVGQRISDVRHPSLRGMMYDADRRSLLGLTAEGEATDNTLPIVCWMDGSASGDALMPGAWKSPRFRRWGSVSWPVMATPNGIHGRDR